MDSIETLSKLFERFPGIGPRQARRFVQFLLRSSPSLRREIAQEIQRLGDAVSQCASCQRFFAGGAKECSLCSNTRRDSTLLMLVASDNDLDTIERSGTYKGHYFVLGGTVILGKDVQPHLRESQLTKLLKQRAETGLAEVILAFPANPEGDTTAGRMKNILDTCEDIRVSTLGRGLSTGSEIEYADADTIRAALEGRH